MKNVYFIKYNKYREIKNPKISYILRKTLILSINCDKCGSNQLSKKDQLRYYKFLV